MSGGGRGRFGVRAAIFLLALGVGCRSPRIWTRVDSWHRPVPDAVRSGDWTALEEARIREIPDELQSGAQKLLEGAACISLSAEEVGRWSGMPSNRGGVLVRALALNPHTGGFRVSHRGPAVHVHHGCLGRSPVPMKRRAVVLLGVGPFREVYVTCSMDE